MYEDLKAEILARFYDCGAKVLMPLSREAIFACRELEREGILERAPTRGALQWQLASDDDPQRGRGNG